MFIKLARINQKGDAKENLIKLESIKQVIELTLQPTYLYDANGNVVETKEPEIKKYKVFIDNGADIVIGQDAYDTLVEALIK